MNTIGLLIGIIFGLGLSLDLIYSNKTKSYSFYIRNIIAVVTMIVLRLIGLLPQKLEQDQVLQALIFTFLALIISIGLGVSINYLFYRRLKKRYKESIFSNEVITFYNLLINGYLGLTQSIKEGKKKEEDRLLEDKDSLFRVMENMSEPISVFLIKIYKGAFMDADPLGYIILVLQNFVRQFLAESEARFILRKIDMKNNQMVAFKTTSDNVPSPIPLNKTNMIVESMKLNAPLIYSRNTQYHYETNKSLSQGKYRDYVSYCLLQKNGIPIFSITLDVKSEETQKKMFAIVDSHIFEVICAPIKEKLKQIAKGDNI